MAIVCLLWHVSVQAASRGFWLIKRFKENSLQSKWTLHPPAPNSPISPVHKVDQCGAPITNVVMLPIVTAFNSYNYLWVYMAVAVDILPGSFPSYLAIACRIECGGLFLRDVCTTFRPDSSMLALHNANSVCIPS